MKLTQLSADSLYRKEKYNWPFMHTTLILVLLNAPRWQGIAFLLLQTNGKGKVVPLHATNAYGGVKVQPLILNLGIRWW
jgi:hypothetical protein